MINLLKKSICLINFSYINLGNRVEWRSFMNADGMRSFTCLSKTLLKGSKWCYLQSINSFADYSWSDLVVYHTARSLFRGGWETERSENNRKTTAHKIAELKTVICATHTLRHRGLHHTVSKHTVGLITQWHHLCDQMMQCVKFLLISSPPEGNEVYRSLQKSSVKLRLDLTLQSDIKRL